MEIIIVIIILIIYTILGNIAYWKGNRKATKKLNKEIEKIKLTNPHIYYRDIPVKYGIGICALLLDYKITERDLKAAIIDLSAKGYLKIDTKNKKVFSVTITNKDTSDLLKNEKYLLNWIKKNNNAKIKFFNLVKWEKIIVEDAIKLELGTKRKTKLIKFDNKKLELYTYFLSFLVFIITYIYINFMNENIDNLVAFEYIKVFFQTDIVTGIIFGIIIFIVFLIASSIPALIVAFLSYVIFYVIGGLLSHYRVTKHNAYNLKMHKSIKLTHKSIDELQKVYSLGAFLKDFSAFAERSLDEIVIWQRYFSFAYLFGLNNKLDLKYTKLFKNSYFNIDYEVELVNFIEVNGIEKLNEFEKFYEK